MDKDNSLEKGGYDHKKWSVLGFFSGESSMIFLFKKTERITAALYMVSGLLKDSEPLKWELREKGVLLLGTALSLNTIEPFDKSNAVQVLFTTALETLTLLHVALIAGLISDMNHLVLSREIEAVVSLLKEKVAEDTSRAGYILSDSFFKTDVKNEEVTLEKNDKGHHKGHNMGMQNIQRNDLNLNRNISLESKLNLKNKVILKDKKNSRRDRIIELLKKQSGLTIKDFTKVINDCSEKTIQRELIELVNKGIVKRDGERRWSTYSLK